MPNFECGQCHNQDLEYKTGKSKKTGKAWSGWRCNTCNIMYDMAGKPWGAPVKPFVPYNAPKPVLTQESVQPVHRTTQIAQSNSVTLETLDKKLDLIIEGLKFSVALPDDKSEAPF